jgi:acetylornithine deacetylase
MGRLLVAIEAYADQLRTARTDPLLGAPTLSVGRIEGGLSVNTVPDRCRIEIDRRLLPGEDGIAVMDEFAAWLRTEGGIDFPFACLPTARKALPALAAHGSDEITARLGRAIDRVKGSHRLDVVPYGTDAAIIAAAGIPAVVFGPGDIAQAHTRDEWVDLDEVAAASEILYQLAVGS